MRTLVVAGVAALLPLTAANGADTSILKLETSSPSIEHYLPSPTPVVPWLQLDTRTKMPKGDYPIGRQADAPPTLLLQSTGIHSRYAVHDIGGRS